MNENEKQIIKQKLIKDELAVVLAKIKDGYFDNMAEKILIKKKRRKAVREAYEKSKSSFLFRIFLGYICYPVLWLLNFLILTIIAVYRFSWNLSMGWFLMVLVFSTWQWCGPAYWTELFPEMAEWEWQNFFFGGTIAGSWLHLLIANNTLMMIGACSDDWEGDERCAFGVLAIIACSIFIFALARRDDYYVAEFLILQFYWIVIAIALYVIFWSPEKWKESLAAQWLEELKEKR